jgi:hypothetical protein
MDRAAMRARAAGNLAASIRSATHGPRVGPVDPPRALSAPGRARRSAERAGGSQTSRRLRTTSVRRAAKRVIAASVDVAIGAAETVKSTLVEPAISTPTRIATSRAPTHRGAPSRAPWS